MFEWKDSQYQPTTEVRKWLALSPSILFLIGLLLGCGQTASDEASENGGVGSLANVSGSIRGLSGNASEMAGWVVVFSERDSGISRVAEVGPIGTYAINGLAIDKAQTLLLLDLNYRISSVIAAPSENATQLKQYFKVSSPLMPMLVQKGPTVVFADPKGIAFEKDTCLDANNDGIPDGLSSAPFVTKLVNQGNNTRKLASADREDYGDASYSMQQDAAEYEQSSNGSDAYFMATKLAIDTDNDGIKNGEGDPDIDGDGLMNHFDSDINGNGILNIFDPDANGDGVIDTTQNNSELNYNSGLEYGFVQVVQQVKSSSLATQLVFTAKVRPEMTDATISVRGPSSLFDGAQSQAINPETGSVSAAVWDRTLQDDGLNQDGVAKDQIYARSVVLADGKSLKSNQVVFIDITKKIGQVPVSMSFPYTFPALTTAPIGASYNSNSRIFTRTGTPYVGNTEYRWSVHVFNASGNKVFSSEPILGTVSTYTLPSNLLESGVKHTAVIYAEALDRVSTYASWVIKSESISL